MGEPFENRKPTVKLLPCDGYRCVIIDPPWNERGGGRIRRGAQKHYQLLKTPDIIDTVKKAHLWQPADDAHLWLWATDNFLEDGFLVIKALGFRYVRTMAWMKVRNGNLQIGLGQYLRGSHELCLFGVRGSTMKPVKAPPSVVMAERTQHSRKPDAAYEAIVKVSPGPRLEMFARVLALDGTFGETKLIPEISMGNKPRKHAHEHGSINRCNTGLYLILMKFERPKMITFGKRQASEVVGPLAVYIGTAQERRASQIERHLGLRPKGALQWDGDWVPFGLTQARDGIPVPRRRGLSVASPKAQSLADYSYP